MKRLILSSRNRLKSYAALTLVFGILAIHAIANLALAKSAEPNDARYEAYVVGIADGDTITVLTNQNEQVKIRLYGIDCPEKKQAFGTKARQFIADLVFNKAVSIQPIQRDRYGRLVAKVYVDNRDVGLTMIEYGYAWWYQQYAKKATDYKQAQAKARRQQLGLWADANPVAPWMFRKHKGEQ